VGERTHYEPGAFCWVGLEVAILCLQQPEARAAGVPPHWTSYISVEDADATARRAGELGGAAVFREPFDVLEAGRVAAIRDPTGAIVSLWRRAARWTQAHAGGWESKPGGLPWLRIRRERRSASSRDRPIPDV
jgi:uncharacterized protein